MSIANTNTFIESKFNTSFMLRANSYKELAKAIAVDNLGVLWTDIEKYFSSITYFPFIIPHIDEPKTLYLRLRKTQTALDDLLYTYLDLTNVEIVDRIKTGKGQLIYLASTYYDDDENFLSFEPFTKVELSLPFYGNISVKISDIFKRYIHFFISIDYVTGAACYYIYTSRDNMSEYVTVQSLNDLQEIRLLTMITFQLGYRIPINTLNTSELVSNIVLSGVKSALGSLSSAITVMTPTRSVSHTDTVTSTQSSKQSKYLGVFKNTKQAYDEQITESTRVTETYHAPSNINNSMLSGNFTSEVYAKTSENSILNINSNRFINIVRTRMEYNVQDAQYKHIYGAPLNVSKNCNEITGFVRFSNFHISIPNNTIASNPKTNIGLITYEELNMINDIMTSGAYI